MIEITFSNTSTFNKKANEQAQVVLIVVVEAIRKLRGKVNFPPLEKASGILAQIFNLKRQSLPLLG